MEIKGLNLQPRKAPSQTLALTNKAYISRSDLLGLFAVPTEGHRYVEVKGCVFSVETHDDVETGTVSFTYDQRRFARISLSEPVLVKPFVPPPVFDLGSCSFEVDFVCSSRGGSACLELEETKLDGMCHATLLKHVLAKGQGLSLDCDGVALKLTVANVRPLDVGATKPANPRECTAGMLSALTQLVFQVAPSAAGRLYIQGNGDKPLTSIFCSDFDFEELGIGGLSKEFTDIFRRAFAARCLPPNVIRGMGLQHVKGMLLYGPPGTGKTLIARQLAKFLKSAEPKIVNGPEILSKFVGEAERGIRDLFKDAEMEQAKRGDSSQLHVIIFDEMDALCKRRGSSGDSAGVISNVVNQLLTKLDGVSSLSNVLIIGMTNRKDLIDPALLRPGRLELHVEIGLPDAAGRAEILNIHTSKMRANGYLSEELSIAAIASKTRNYSGADLAGVVRAAQSFAVTRRVDVRDLSGRGDQQQVKETTDDISITSADFERALLEVRPAFGCDGELLDRCLEHGMIEYSPEFCGLMEKCKGFVEQARTSERTSLLTLLLAGETGCGKTALAAQLARDSGFPFVRRISNEAYIGDSEQTKIARIADIFDDAGKSELSFIILDDLESLLDYVCIGPRFSNVVLQGLLSLLRRRPTKPSHRMMVIGTTSDVAFMKETRLIHAFSAALSVPRLRSADHYRAVLREFPEISPEVLGKLCARLDGTRLGIKTLLLVVDMATQRHSPIKVELFLECLQDALSTEEDSCFELI